MLTGAVKPGVGGGWRVGLGCCHQCFSWNKSSSLCRFTPNCHLHLPNTHVPAVVSASPGASPRRVSSSTEPISCSLSLSRSLSFDFHLKNSSWPLSLPPSPIPVLCYMDDPSCSSSWRRLHSWPTAQLLPTRGGGPGVFLLEQGPGRKGVLLGSRSLHREMPPSSGGLTHPFWPLFGDRGLWSQVPGLDNSKGD